MIMIVIVILILISLPLLLRAPQNEQTTDYTDGHG